MRQLQYISTPSLRCIVGEMWMDWFKGSKNWTILGLDWRCATVILCPWPWV